MINLTTTSQGNLDLEIKHDDVFCGLSLNTEEKTAYMWVIPSIEHTAHYERVPKEFLEELRDNLNRLLYDVETENLVPDTLTLTPPPALPLSEAKPTDLPKNLWNEPE